jgi:hypothetical protein
MLILGDIGQMREEAERANDLKRVLRLHGVQCCFQIAAGRQILVAAEADRVLPNALDGVEDRVAALLAYRVAENAAE